jgi:quercetin dioxygenase-like cupin family protein
MRITQADLRIVRRGGMTVRFAPMGPVVYLLVELGESGTAGTTLEAPCTSPHWALILSGDLEVSRDGLEPVRLEAGQAFHVPGGDPAHRFRASGRSAAVGFAPLGPPRSDDGTIGGAAFEFLDELGGPPIVSPAVGITVVDTAGPLPLRRGQIASEASIMGPWLMCTTRFGGVSGYTTSWCDLPHWGTVLQGTIAIESEDDVEIMGAGDAFYCPAGPPGHRIEVTDAATVMDLTPIEAMIRPGRVADWRPRLTIAPRPSD